MSCCFPSCTVPTCVPSCSPPVCYPVGGLGSLNPCAISAAGGVSASSLGIPPGASVGCISQIPPSEIVIQQAAFTTTPPGATLSASFEPVRVGGFTLVFSLVIPGLLPGAPPEMIIVT